MDCLAGEIGPDALERTRLLVSELVTNSLRHAGLCDETDGIEVEVTLAEECLRVEVRDPGPGFTTPHRPQPHPDRPGGLGLLFVDELADRWGVHTNDETIVWFELQRGEAA